MNVKRLKSVYMAMAVIGVFGPLLAAGLSKFAGVGQEETTAVFLFLFGVGAASLLHHHLAEKAYVVSLFRLHGWKDGSYAVQLRVYEDGITYHTDNRLIQTTDERLPAAPRWTPYKGSQDAVIVCDQVYR